jgi:hypothetical protein
MKTLATAPDPADARQRLRAALRRIIAEVWVLVVAHGRDRLAVVQVYFAGKREGRRRTYVIFYRPPRSNATGKRHEAVSFVQAVTEEAGGALGLQAIDLRDRGEAAKAVRGIERWPASEWDAYAAAAAATP